MIIIVIVISTHYRHNSEQKPSIHGMQLQNSHKTILFIIDIIALHKGFC